jgi:anti-sigma regulatory factor (Ser/Thr protein kinase)
VSPRVETIELPSQTIAARLARHQLEPLLASLRRDRRPDARLLVSELVTNAFRHGMPPITLTTALHPGFLRVEVADAGGGRPRRRARPSADGGWGLLLVEQASDRWGVADGSMRVWFEIDRG